MKQSGKIPVVIPRFLLRKKNTPSFDSPWFRLSNGAFAIVCSSLVSLFRLIHRDSRSLRELTRRKALQNLASNHGIVFRPARANQAHRNPQSVFFLRFSLSAAASQVKRQPSKAIGSHGTTAALLAIAVKTGPNGASECVFVSERVCHYRILQQ